MCTIEIRPGQGGQDAAAFAAALAAALQAWARRQQPPPKASVTAATRTITLVFPGLPAAAAEWLAGVHRLQHAPRSDRRGRRHTSTATITVLPDTEAGAPIRIRPGDLTVQTMRRRGRGGQRKNKVETAVRIRHSTGITVTRRTGRSQAANIAAAADAIERALQARELLELAADQDRRRHRQAQRAARAKIFTHNAQRGVVTDHLTGQTWPVRAWQQGRLGPGATSPPADAARITGPSRREGGA